MTTLSNEMVLAELGWTMKIIHDSTGGRVPRFWRPPYGDSDSRVRAIAKVSAHVHSQTIAYTLTGGARPDDRHLER